ncbi:transducin-like [Hordeum vulgare]|nr:transducin-like [Hordeum vulgare]
MGFSPAISLTNLSPMASPRERSAMPPPPSSSYLRDLLERDGADDAVGTVVVLQGRGVPPGAPREVRGLPRAAGEAAAGEHAVVLADLELAIESIERLADASPSPRDSKIRSLRNSIRLLGVVAALHAPPGPADSGEGDARGVPSSHLSACAQLYLAVVYKMESDPHLLHSSWRWVPSDARDQDDMEYGGACGTAGHVSPGLWFQVQGLY